MIKHQLRLYKSIHLTIGMDPFGAETIKRSWDDGSESLDNYKRRLHASFEFFSKLGKRGTVKGFHLFPSIKDFLSLTGVKYWSFHDRDISPEGRTLEESNAMVLTYAAYFYNSFVYIIIYKMSFLKLDETWHLNCRRKLESNYCGILATCLLIHGNILAHYHHIILND